MINKARKTAYGWLRWSERYTKTDMLYLTKGGAWLFLSQVIAIIVGLGVSIALANLISPEVFGNYKFVLSLAGIIGAFSLTGITTAIARSVSKGNEGSLRQGFKASLQWSIGIILLSFIGALYYYLNGNLVLATSLLIVGTFSPLSQSATLFGAYLTGKKEFRTQTIYNVGRTILSAAVFILTLSLTSNPVLIILVYFAGNALVTSYYYHRTLKVFQPSVTKDPDLVPYSTHLSVMNFMIFIGNHIDKVLAFHFLGAAPLALYAFAIAPVEQLRSGNKIVQTLVLPKLSERQYSELQQSVPRRAVLLFLLAVLMVILYVFFAPLLYKLLFPQYIDAIFLSQLYALILLAAPVTLFNQMLFAHQKKRELYIAHIFIPTVKIILFFVLLPLYGLLGLITALIIAKLFGLLLTAFLSLRISSV